jgi:hypothetical protein
MKNPRLLLQNSHYSCETEGGKKWEEYLNTVEIDFYLAQIEP